MTGMDPILIGKRLRKHPLLRLASDQFRLTLGVPVHPKKVSDRVRVLCRPVKFFHIKTSLYGPDFVS